MDRPQNPRGLIVKPTPTGLSIEYDGLLMVAELGAGVPLNGRWRWSFDGSLERHSIEEETGSDALGEYSSLAITYTDENGPVVQQAVRAYHAATFVVVEALALRELRGTALADNFFETTFNLPVLRLDNGLGYLTYTWGLMGGEGTGIAGHFPDAALAQDLAGLPEQLRLADFSPDREVHHTGDKPFAPLIAYDIQERTLVASPLNHYLISPLRLVETPAGRAVARGLHGSVDVIPEGTTTRTMLTFGQGLVATVLKWGELLFQAAGQDPKMPADSLIASSLGFWNCYGGYYAELFRPTSADTLKQLSNYFHQADLPVRYWGLDLWYQFDRVGFARRYIPDPEKYPDGLEAVLRSTGIPFLLHMSSFDLATEYQDAFDMKVEEGSAYPTGPELYEHLAREFKGWGATGIWHDFLRTLIQNCRSLRQQIGAADRWFDTLATSMAGAGARTGARKEDAEELDVMLCMPTMGHYLASVSYANVVAVRTSTDFVNHQAGQLELLAHMDEYRRMFSPQRNLRQNLMLSFLAGALRLAPSHDVFITNREHPEGFANPHASRDALMRALSAGVVGVGDKLGHLDPDVVGGLAFPDGALAQPDHPLYPVASTLQSDTPCFYTETLVSGYRWTYLVLFNLTEEIAEYDLDLSPVFGAEDGLVFDFHAQSLVDFGKVRGTASPGEGRYFIGVPRVGGLFPLGFVDKYVPVSGRQMRGITVEEQAVAFDLDLPPGRDYSFAVIGDENLSAAGQGINVTGVQRRGLLTHIDFHVGTRSCRLVLALQPDGLGA